MQQASSGLAWTVLSAELRPLSGQASAGGAEVVGGAVVTVCVAVAVFVTVGLTVTAGAFAIRLLVAAGVDDDEEPAAAAMLRDALSKRMEHARDSAGSRLCLERYEKSPSRGKVTGSNDPGRG